jgi:hypothetical protein
VTSFSVMIADDAWAARRTSGQYTSRERYVRIYPEDTITPCNGHTRKCCRINPSMRRRSRREAEGGPVNTLILKRSPIGEWSEDD